MAISRVYRPLLALLAATATLASPAAASDIIKLTDIGSVEAHGTFVGPFQGTILSRPGLPTIDMYCVDFAHRIHLGQEWEANFTRMSTDLGATRGGNGALDDYRRAAWLSTQFHDGNQMDWADIHATIWQLFYAQAPAPGDGGYWLAQANLRYHDISAGDWVVITPVDMQDPASAQEFVYRDPNTVVPEPGTYLLLGTGLLTLMLTGLVRRIV